jgi:predicted ABC-type ATPase
MVRNQVQKSIQIIAGPNGAGKTTFVQNYLDRYVDCDEFLNADLIAAGLSPFAPEREALAASQIFLERLNKLEQGERSFALETTLAARSYKDRIRNWKSLGFTVNLMFLWLPSPEFAIQRVAERVIQGGHNIPEPDIRRRYDRGLKNLFDMYLPIVDDVWIMNASVIPPDLVLERLNGKVNILIPDVWQRLQPREDKTS